MSTNVVQGDAEVGARGAPAEVALRAERLTKVFDSGVVAVDDVTVDIRKGEFISVVGPSGCGKSTLLRLVAGLIERSSGSLTVGGAEVNGPRADIGVMFQQPTLLPWRTALDNVVLPIEVHRRVRRADRAQAMDLLRLVGIEDFAASYPRHLSGGMQQRVALARLLMMGADLILLDEPFGALDEFTRERLNIELSRIQAEVGATALFVTHNISEAVFLADRVLVMSPRPGRLASILDVPFERPRGIELLKSPEFNEICFAAREALGGAE